MAAYDFSAYVSTFRTPGRAGTAGQKIFSIHNGVATSAPRVVTVSDVSVTMYATVVKAVTVAPPLVRAWKVTVLPTNGTAATKVAINSSIDGANTAITVLQDASADGTSSASALTATLPSGTFFSSKVAPRILTAAGYVVPETINLVDEPIILRSGEGLVVFLDYTDAASNPVTDMWAVNVTYSSAVVTGTLL